MTQHEVLAFVDGLHEYMKRVTGKESIAWPTRELLRENFRLNRALWGSGWQSQYHNAVTEARRRHWLAAGPGEGCSVHCHAEHIRLTSAGAQALRLMNEEGCSAHVTSKRERCEGRADFGFNRKLAA